jgi:hypothetical protein
MNPVFLMFGFGSEYVLSPLARYLAEKGHDVVELDMGQGIDIRTTVQSLKGRDIIFISSAHPNYNAPMLKIGHEKDIPIFSTLEIMMQLRPIASFYIPHDLNHPIHHVETPYMRFFDAVLAPTEDLWWLNRFAPVVNVGWAKHVPSVSRYVLAKDGNQNPTTVLFLSEIWYFFLHGVDVIYEKYRLLFELGIPFKFPVWPDVEKLEDALAAKGAKPIPAATSTYDLIQQADLVLVNAKSSTLVESTLTGKRSLCLLDDIHPALFQKQNFIGLPNVAFMTIPEAASVVQSLRNGQASLPAVVPGTLKSFDFDKAYATIQRYAGVKEVAKPQKKKWLWG